eukprot:PhF_6_TR37501/c0_g1_i3/m.55379/K03021/RPC2, POLR3B; DNA-directed RNA polymerase III subunit RPC2
MESLYDPLLRTAPIKTVDDKWKLVPAFIAAKGFIRQHVSSYNHFIEDEMRKIMLANREVRVATHPTFYLRYNKIYVEMPTMTENVSVRDVTPHECRLRDLSYMGNIKVDVEYIMHTPQGEKPVSRTGVVIGRIPIMLRSQKCHLYGKTAEELVQYRECPMDPGGYFIVRGNEKVIMVQEQQSKNRIIIEKDMNGNVCANVHSSTHFSKGKSVLFAKGLHIYLKHNSLTEELPVVILLKALGMVWDQEIVLSIGTTPQHLEMLAVCLHDSQQQGIVTQEQALEYVGGKMKRAGEADSRGQRRSPSDSAAEWLANVFLCHIKENEIAKDWNFRCKAVYVCLMMRRVILATGNLSLLDDKDYFGNKRFELAGTLLSYLFEDMFKRFNAALKEDAEKYLGKQSRTSSFDFVTVMRTQMIEFAFIRAINSGNWKIDRFKIDMVGVTQSLARMSYIQTLGMMTKLTSSFDKTRKVSGPRALHASQWGVVCPSDTPEGESIGLVKNFSLLCQVTNDNEEMESVLLKLCVVLGVEDIELISAEDLHSKWTVFLNGQVIGVHSVPVMLIEGIKSLRRQGRLDPFVSVYRQEVHKAIYIGCDGGRMC